MKIAREGLLFILPASGLAVVFLLLGWRPLFVLLLLIALALTFFFRDPKRIIPGDDRLILSPADGTVLRIDGISSHPEIAGPVTRITIFLSLFNVHITRSPITGTVQKEEYHPGKFLPAYKDAASQENESRSLLLRGENAPVFIKQIVGVAARRIKSFTKAGDRVRQGQKIGLMYFGSRVEVYLPAGFTVRTGPEEKVKAGLTVIAEVKK